MIKATTPNVIINENDFKGNIINAVRRTNPKKCDWEDCVQQAWLIFLETKEIFFRNDWVGTRTPQSFNGYLSQTLLSLSKWYWNKDEAKGNETLDAYQENNIQDIMKDEQFWELLSEDAKKLHQASLPNYIVTMQNKTISRVERLTKEWDKYRLEIAMDELHSYLKDMTEMNSSAQPMMWV